MLAQTGVALVVVSVDEVGRSCCAASRVLAMFNSLDNEGGRAGTLQRASRSGWVFLTRVSPPHLGAPRKEGTTTCRAAVIEFVGGVALGFAVGAALTLVAVW